MTPNLRRAVHNCEFVFHYGSRSLSPSPPQHPVVM